MTKSLDLPMGTQKFETLRKFNEIYVDKTRLIYELANKRRKYFLSRPRRFGKTLLVSTIRSLFSNGMEYFQGLEIEKLWDDRTYDVVLFDFSTLGKFQTAEEFSSKMRDFLFSSMQESGFEYEDNPERHPLTQLSLWLSKRQDSSLVLLIDEYDAPLTRSLDNSQLFDSVQQDLSDFYSVIKKHEGCLRFFFMTGITKFSNTGIFSGFNNIRDVSLDPKYGELLGYTEDEIENYFASYLDKACRRMNVSRHELMEKLRENYDGFCFDERALTHVYCPWSILNFFDEESVEYKNYWYQSGGQPGVLRKYFELHGLPDPKRFLEPVHVDAESLQSSADYNNMDIRALLQQTGYLAIRSASGAGTLELGYPNVEVESSMARLYTSFMVNDKRFVQKELKKYLLDGDVEELERLLQLAFNSFDYLHHPIRDEATFHAVLQIIILGADVNVVSEKHSALGRSDLELDLSGIRWVLELKYAKSSEEVPMLLDKAVEQIRNRRYGETLPLADKLIRVGVVFDSEKRNLVFKRLGNS